MNTKKILSSLLISVCLLAGMQCWHSPFEEMSEIEYVATLEFILGLLRPPSSSAAGSTASNCNTNINTPTPLTSAVGQKNLTVGPGANCFFKYVAPLNNGRPIFNLITLNDADLYVGVLNDYTAGASGATACTVNSPGEGWIRCARGKEYMKTVSMDQPNIEIMAAGQFRIVAVYGDPAGAGSSSFTLEVVD